MELSSSGSSEQIKKEEVPPPPVETAKREDGTEYPTGIKLGLIVLALCLSVFLMALGK